jgi:hypothetical protein
MAEADLLDFLSVDHQTLLGADSQTVVSQVSQHLGVERDLLYPAIRQHCQEGHALIDRLRDADRALERQLSDFESSRTSEAKTKLDMAIREHVDFLDPLFEQLRKDIPAAQLAEAGTMVPWSIGSAPTHPHPHLAGNPMGEALEEDVATVADHIRDWARRGRQTPRGTGN